MKKSIFCCLLCFLVLFSASCTISITSESEETPTYDNLINPEDSPYYFVLDEDVIAQISDYLGEPFEWGWCYYGEHEGKHVFYCPLLLGRSSSLYIGNFRLYGIGEFVLKIWDGSKFTEYTTYTETCDIFSFETSREIALIHANHLWNSCSNSLHPYCVYARGYLVEEISSTIFWQDISGDYINLPNGEYELKNYCAEQEPIFNGELGVVDCDMGILPGEFKESDSYVVTIENTVGYEEEFTFYGVVADVEEMFQITEDMWLESYDGFNKTEEFDLEKAKALKYCVPIKVSAPSELNVEVCLVEDNLKNSAYVLVFNVNEQTGEKYISQVYEYGKIV